MEAGSGSESNYYKMEPERGTEEEEQSYERQRGYDQKDYGPRRRRHMNDDLKEDDGGYYSRPEPMRYNVNIRPDDYRHTEPISLRNPYRPFTTVPIRPPVPQYRQERYPNVRYERRARYERPDRYSGFPYNWTTQLLILQRMTIMKCFGRVIAQISITVGTVV
jgi:hypothetical protein